MGFRPQASATIIAISSWLGRLPHGDMVVPIWYTMAKTAKFGQNGPHSCVHISIATARIVPTKDARDTWDSGPNICHFPTLMVPLAIFTSGEKVTHKWGIMATYPKLGDSQLSLQEERPHGEMAHSMRVYVPSQNRPYPWPSGARNLGSNVKGKMGFVAILGNTAKIHPKVVTRKIISPFHTRNEHRAFAWMQTEALLPY